MTTGPIYHQRQAGTERSYLAACHFDKTMNHIVDTCPLTKSEGGLNLLQEADDDWLESTAAAARAK